MDLSLTEEQQIIRKETRKVLSKEFSKDIVRNLIKTREGYSTELWRMMSNLGWLGLIIPEEHGGSGASFLDLLILVEEMGRVCLPGPFFSNLVGTLSLLEAADEKQKHEFLPQIANGKLLLTLAVNEPVVGHGLNFMESRARLVDNGYIVNGTKLFVENAHIADFIVLAVKIKKGETQDENLALLLVSAKDPSITITLLDSLGKDKQCEVNFIGLKCPKQNLLGESYLGDLYVERLLPKVALVKAAEMLGGADRVFELACEYAKQRVQFGSPIGTYQIVQFYCADMLICLEAMRSLVYKAGWNLNNNLPYAKEAAMAKIWADRAYKQMITLSIQIHGAIGFTEEYELSLHWLRSKMGQLTLGNYDYLSDLVAREIGL